MNTRPPHGNKIPHTVGSIITWAIVRAVIVIVIALWLYEYVRWIQYSVWWTITAVLIIAVVVYPAQVQYRLFKESAEPIISNTLCSSCRYFEESAVMCSRYDEHVTEEYLPCDGLDWEPLSVEERRGDRDLE